MSMNMVHEKIVLDNDETNEALGVAGREARVEHSWFGGEMATDTGWRDGYRHRSGASYSPRVQRYRQAPSQRQNDDTRSRNVPSVRKDHTIPRDRRVAGTVAEAGI
jgi:hypothetical protein